MDEELLPSLLPRGEWEGRVAYGEGPGGRFAYRPRQLIVRGEAALDRVRSLLVPDETKVYEDSDGNYLLTFSSGVDVPHLAAGLRNQGHRAEPNYVLFAHCDAPFTCGPHPSIIWANFCASPFYEKPLYGDPLLGTPPYGDPVNTHPVQSSAAAGSFEASPLHGNPLYGNPLYGNPLYGNPLYGNPLYGNPLYGNPLYGNPLYGNPLYGNPLYGNPLYGNPLYGNPLYGNPLYGNPLWCHPCADPCSSVAFQGKPVHVTGYMKTGMRKSSARPAEAPTLPQFKQGAASAKVAVLDSGLAETAQTPQMLRDLDAATAIPDDRDGPDENNDRSLDPAAGHGTFIAGVVRLLAPVEQVAVGRVLTTFGDGDQWTVGDRLDKIVNDGLGEQSVGKTSTSNLKFDDKTILNLSFGSYVPGEAWYLAQKLRKVQQLGVVIVASAGNDATCRPMYPACLPDVVSVGALGPTGPAPFTNYGPWVRACAPGVDIVSSFFQNFDGPSPPAGGTDPDKFTGWACWSGTSFAAPVVVAALAREMALTGCKAKEAVERIIDAPGLLKIPGLGTVVNIA